MEHSSSEPEAIVAVADWLVRSGAIDLRDRIISVLTWHSRRLPDQVRSDFFHLVAIEYIEELHRDQEASRAAQEGSRAALILRVTDRVRKKLLRQAYLMRSKYAPLPEEGVSDPRIPIDQLEKTEFSAKIKELLSPEELAIWILLEQNQTQSSMSILTGMNRKKIAEMVKRIGKKIHKFYI